MNQLISVAENGTPIAQYAYDALGRRIAKTVGGATTAYVHDIGDLRDVTTHDRLLEFEDGALSKRWLHGQNIDEPVAYEAYGADATPGAGTAYSLHADRQGSVIAVTDQATGTLVARYRFDAFGQREEVLATVAQDIGFTGREYDAESGLYHFRARAYDPAAGRFIQSDPLGFAAGDLNLYAYTWNDPANWTDPSGLSPSAENSGTTGAVAGLSRTATRKVATGVRCLAKKVSTFLTGMGRVVAQGRDISQMRVASGPNCRTRVAAPRNRCGCGGGASQLTSSLGFSVAHDDQACASHTDRLNGRAHASIAQLVEQLFRK